MTSEFRKNPTEKSLKNNPASKIAYEKDILKKEISSESEEIRFKIEQAIQNRKLLMDKLTANGLRVVSSQYDSLADLYENDDGRNTIDTVIRVNVKTEAEVKKAIDFAKQYNFGVMPIGAKTSALSVFDMDSMARQKGLSGIIGLEMPVLTPSTDNASLLEIESKEAEKEFELISSENLPIVVLKSKNYPEVPNQVITHASVTVQQVNDFLNEVLPSDKYHFQIIADPTSKADATLGGVISCGAEGGNRMSAAHDLLSLKIIDANGDTQILDREESKKQVGLNGTAGVILEARFEVTAFPKKHFGLFIPINGDTNDQVWQNILKLQNSLAKYSKVQQAGNSRMPVVNTGDIVITAMEVLAKKEVLGYLKNNELAQNQGKNSVNKILDSSAKLYVYLRAASENGYEDLITSDLAKDLGVVIGPEEDPMDAFFRNIDEETGDIINTPEEETHQQFFFFQEEGIFDALDKMRHVVAEEARKEAKKLGGISQSTDFNIKFNSENEAENETARELVAKIYAKYIDQFDHNEAFEVAIYGHLFNGFSGEGGGMDPHIRITFKANESKSRYDGPEKIAMMKKASEAFYKELLELNNKFGISVERPEKSLLTNKTYWEWLCLEHPEKAKEAQETMLKFGYTNNGKPLIAFRNGFELPGMPRTLQIQDILNKDLIVPGSANGNLIDKYWNAVLEISQLSHRSPEIKALFGDVSKIIRERLQLNQLQYPFFVERKDEAHEIINKNLGKNHGFKVKELDLVSLDNLSLNDPNTIYIIGLEQIGVPRGLTLLIVPHSAVKVADDRNKTGQNEAKFRNLMTMWRMQPFETEETPNIPAVALLGLIFESDRLRDENFSSKGQVITVNPGPSIVDNSLMRDGSFYLTNIRELNPNLQTRILNDFKVFLKLDPDYDLAFTGSATQMMQVISEALASRKNQLNLIQIVNDAFSERFNAVLDNGKNKLKTITTPWTSSEKSELDRVIKNILDSWDEEKKNLIILTPHKTSTTASFDPNIIITALEKAGKKHKIDFELICDITSGVGAIDYNNADGLGCVFGSVQKGLGCPPGLGFAAFSPSFLKTIFEDNEDFEDSSEYGLKKLIGESRMGTVYNNMHLSMLGHKINADYYRGQNIEKKVVEIREKFEIVLAFLSLHPELSLQVADSIDRSPVLAGIYSQTKNLVVAKRILNDLFNFELGSGYGIYAKESVRLYLANISKQNLRDLFKALHHILELPEVSESTDKTAPVVTLREPFDPLNALSRLSQDFKLDDIYENESGLKWLERLVHTYNSNVLNENWRIKNQIKVGAFEPIKVNGVIPETSNDYNTKASIYGDPKNIGEMEKILRRKDDKEHGYKSLIAYYETYYEQEKVLKMMIENNPEKEMSDYLDTVIQEMESSLRRIVILLEQHLEDSEYLGDRVAWPFLA